MSTFYCLAKAAAKSKTHVFLLIDVPKKSNFFRQPDRVLFYKVR